jgi:selenocysteine lyase/cysteine desulfurase
MPISQSKTAIDAFLAQWSSPRFKYSELMLNTAQRLKEQLGQLLHSEPENFAIFPNTAFGISSVLNSITFNNGDDVLMLDNEFPSNAYPYLALESRGVNVIQIPATEFYLDPIATLNKYSSSATSIFAISHVSYSSGYVCDLDQISTWCRTKNVRLFVDATQGCGVFPINLSKTPVDVMIASGYKWLRWPPGTSFGYINPEYISTLSPQNVGWLSVEDRPNTHYPLRLSLAEDAAKFEPGGLNLLGIIAAVPAMEVILELGIEVISAQLKERYDKLKDEFEARQIFPILGDGNGLTAGIFCIKAPNDAERIYKELEAQDVWITYRNGIMRFSPHYDTPLEDIDQFFKIYDQLN